MAHKVTPDMALPPTTPTPCSVHKTPTNSSTTPPTSTITRWALISSRYRPSQQSPPPSAGSPEASEWTGWDCGTCSSYRPGPDLIRRIDEAAEEYGRGLTEAEA